MRENRLSLHSDVQKLVDELSVVLSDIKNLTNHGDFLLGEASRLLHSEAPAIRHRSNARPSILIVDDDARIIRELLNALSPDFAVMTAKAAEDAFALLKSSSLDAVISNSDLSDGTGIDVLQKAIKEQPPAVRILLARHQSNRIQKYARGHIAQHIVPKPISADDLARTLKSILADTLGDLCRA